VSAGRRLVGAQIATYDANYEGLAEADQAFNSRFAQQNRDQTSYHSTNRRVTPDYARQEKFKGKNATEFSPRQGRGGSPLRMVAASGDSY